MKGKSILAAVLILVTAAVNFASADIIRGIEIDFVTIGNAGNPADTRGSTSCGAVSYDYRIGKYEVTNAQWDSFIAAAGAPIGNPNEAYDESASLTGAQQPTNYVSWYEAAQFCNYLTSGDKSLGAYQLGTDGSITINRAAAVSAYDTAYVIPTEDEWYKAAYYKPDGNGYSLYANGLDTIPSADNGWNYGGGDYNEPWDVGTGTQEQNGTFDMMGNVFEWNESFLYPPYRCFRGGFSNANVVNLSSQYRGNGLPYQEYYDGGFRVATVPEPATLFLLSFGTPFLRKRKKQPPRRLSG